MLSCSRRAPQELQEHLLTTLKETLHAMHKKCFSHHGKEILHGYVEICTKKKQRNLQPRNRNALASRKDASFRLTEGSSRKRKATNTQPTEHSTVHPRWS